MTYEEALLYFESIAPLGSQPQLERINELLKRLGNPEQKLKFVHVGGTNGKGSVSTYTANILKQAGYKTGLFVSPYIFDFCEMIMLNGVQISKEIFAALTLKITTALGEFLNPTEFEVLTAMAILYFAEQECDIAVMEVGLGGRLDATNVIPPPEIAVITSISIDHEKYLGSTIEKIAEEKCGIIKKNCKVITYPLQDKNALEIIKTHTNPIIPNPEFKLIGANIKGSEFEYENNTYKLKMAGTHQIYNAICAMKAAEFFNATPKNVFDGLYETALPGRMQIIKESPLWLVDGGHNPNGFEIICNVIDEYLKNINLYVIMAIFADKDYNSCIRKILPHCNKLILTKTNSLRALDPKDVFIDGCFEKADSLEEAIKMLPTNVPVLFCGSFTMCKELN